ncbi:MAG TPA: hypothetical protein VGL99_26090 [Chloroflexota bacterium]
MRLRAALDETPTPVLRRIAASHGLPEDEAATRAELVDRLVERLADRTYLAELIAGLAEDEREALLAARASGGEMRGLLIDRDQPGAATALTERGLLFRTFAAAGPRRGEIFALPDELLDVLPEPPAHAPPRTQAEPPEERRATDPAFSLFALASSLARHGSHLGHEVVEWSAEPGGFEFPARWNFLRHLALASGLLDEHGAAPALRRALNDRAALADRLRRAYLRDRAISELANSGIGVEHAELLAEPTLVRAAVVDAVEHLPEGAWLTIDDVSSWLERTRPDFLREQLDARALVLLESRPWSDVERPLLRYTLLGPLYWLGIVAASADGQLIARRSVHRAAAPEACTWHTSTEPPAPAHAEHGALLDADLPAPAHDDRPAPARAELPAPASAEHGTLLDADRPATARAELPAPAQPELPAPASSEPAAPARPELLVPARAELGTLLDAERYLVLEERGRISRYRLVQQHVAAALGSGGSIDECRKLLVRLTRGPLPAAIEDALRAWRERFGALVLRPAVVLEARSAGELDVALAEESVAPFIQRRPGPTTAEVAAADALALAAALRSSGHLPRVDAALRLVADPRHGYSGLVDEHVLEFLLVSLLAFQHARPERLAELEGALSLLRRLEGQFPAERLAELRHAARRLAGELHTAPPKAPPKAPRKASRTASPKASRTASPKPTPQHSAAAAAAQRPSRPSRRPPT